MKKMGETRGVKERILHKSKDGSGISPGGCITQSTGGFPLESRV